MIGKICQKIYREKEKRKEIFGVLLKKGERQNKVSEGFTLEEYPFSNRIFLGKR